MNKDIIMSIKLNPIDLGFIYKLNTSNKLYRKSSSSLNNIPVTEIIQPYEIILHEKNNPNNVICDSDENNNKTLTLSHDAIKMIIDYNNDNHCLPQRVNLKKEIITNKSEIKYNINIIEKDVWTKSEINKLVEDARDHGERHGDLFWNDFLKKNELI